ncbi:MAG: hypothetical protein ACR2J9_03135 [Gaiellales bacterium]
MPRRTPFRRLLVTALVLCLGLSLAAAAADARVTADHGFGLPFDGAHRYEKCAPPRMTNPRLQLNQPLGQKRADEIAVCLGLDKSRVFNQKQYLQFITGGGDGGSKAAAADVDASVMILTNTIGSPYLIRGTQGRIRPIILAGYGLYVQRVRRTTDPDTGVVTTTRIPPTLMSPANPDAPTYKFNHLIGPGAYFETWAKANGATDSLNMLRSSAYLPEIPWSLKSQKAPSSVVTELATHPHSGEMVGISMVPSLWNINFTLIYTLNPKLAARMPAYWAPLPAAVAAAIESSPTGQVPFADYAQYLPQHG